MTKRIPQITPKALGLNGSREFRRSQRHKECEARGFHVRSGTVENKIMGGKSYPMELCAHCDVWVEMRGARLPWKKIG